jgi:hypothetical protein
MLLIRVSLAAMVSLPSSEEPMVGLSLVPLLFSGIGAVFLLARGKGIVSVSIGNDNVVTIGR